MSGHTWAADGFCVYCHNHHRTDLSDRVCWLTGWLSKEATKHSRAATDVRYSSHEQKNILSETRKENSEPSGKESLARH